MAENTIIKIARGMESTIPAPGLDTQGRLLYALDSNKLFIDNGSENVLINDINSENIINIINDNIEDINWDQIEIDASRITFTPVNGITGSTLQAAIALIGSKINNTDTNLSGLNSTVVEMNTALGNLNNELIATNADLGRTNENLYGTDAVAAGFLGPYLEQRLEAGEGLFINRVDVDNDPDGDPSEWEYSKLVISAVQKPEPNRFSTSELLTPVLGTIDTIELSTLTPLVIGTIPTIGDIVMDANGVTASITEIDDVSSPATVSVLVYYIVPTASFSTLGGNARDNADLANELDAKLNKNFVTDLVEDIQIDGGLTGKTPLWKKVLRAPSTLATSTVTFAELTSSNGSISFDVSGTTIDLAVVQIDGGSWDS